MSHNSLEPKNDDGGGGGGGGDSDDEEPCSSPKPLPQPSISSLAAPSSLLEAAKTLLTIEWRENDEIWTCKEEKAIPRVE